MKSGMARIGCFREHARYELGLDWQGLKSPRVGSKCDQLWLHSWDIQLKELAHID